MSVDLLIALAALLLANNDLIGLAVHQHFGGDTETIHQRGTDAGLGAIAHHEHVTKLNMLAFLELEAVDFQLLGGLHFELLTGDLYDGVHGS